MPTVRQKKAVEAIVENGGIVSKGMVEAGYSPATAKTPQKLTESKGWQELMQEYLPDHLLAEKHLELLNKREVVYSGYGEDREAEVTDQPDTQAVSKGLDMAYKLKGSYAPEKHESKVTLEPLTAEQIQALTKLTLVNTPSPEQSNNGNDSGTPLPV